MSLTKHEEMLLIAIKALEEAGHRVIRLDRRRTPDAIAINFDSKRVIAVESSTSAGNYHYVRKRLDGQYDEDIIITNQYSDRYYPREAYFLAIKLRKEGKTYNAIRNQIKKKFGKKPALSTLHDWVTGEKAPPEVSKRHVMPIKIGNSET